MKRGKYCFCKSNPKTQLLKEAMFKKFRIDPSKFSV